MRTIDEIIMHCTATPAGRDVSVREIDSWHRRQGYRMVGYHYVVRLDGSVETGRPESAIGAHCKDHNARSVGVCYVGGIGRDGQPADTRTEAQRRSLKALIEKLRKKYPAATVHGHREFAAKACPCFDAAAEYQPNSACNASKR